MQENTISILTSINATVKQIAQNMAPKNGSGPEATAKLSKGDLNTKADVNPAADTTKQNISTANIGDIVIVLNRLSPSILAVAKLSGNQIKNFQKVLDTVISSINKLSECAKNNKEASDSAKKLIEAMDILSSGIKKMPSLIINAPLAMLGLNMANSVIKTLDKVLKTVNRIDNVNERIKKLGDLTKAIDPIITFVVKASLLVAVCMGLGLLIQAGPTRDLIIGGFIALGGVIIASLAVVLLTKLAGMAIKESHAFASLRDIMAFTLGSVLLVAACFGLGLAIDAMGGWEPLMKGLGIVALTVLAIGFISIITGVVGIVAGSKEVKTALVNILLLTIGAIALIIGAKYLADFAEDNWDKIFEGLGITALTMIGLWGLGMLASTLGSISKEALISFAAVEALAVGAMGVVYIAKKLSDEIEGKYDQISEAVLYTAAILTLFGEIAYLAGTLESTLIPGAIALGAVELVAAAAIGVVSLLITLHNFKEDNGLTWSDLEVDILGVSAIIGTVGVLAGVAGLAAEFIIPGAIALGAVSLLMVAMMGATTLLVKFHQIKEESGTSWGELELDVLGMSAVMGTMGVLAGVLAPLIIPVTLGTPAMIAISGFALLASGVVLALSAIVKSIESAGGRDKLVKTLSQDLPAILKNVNSDNFDVDMGMLTLLKLTAKYAVIASLVLELLTVADAISKIAQIAGVVDDQGRIRQVLSIDKENGEIKYGEPVDIKNVATAISGAIKAFVENSQYGFEDVMSVYNAAEIFKVLATITEPVSKFVEMLTGYVGGVDGSGKNTLAPVYINEKGEIQIGQPVDIEKVATTIATAISSFVSELYKKENTEHWAELIYGDRTFFEGLFGQTNKRADSVREVAGILGIIVDPICKFVDMLVNLEPGDDGTLKKVIVDSNGNIKSGPAINVKKSAGIIADLMTSFITTIYGDANTWDRISEDKGDALKKLLNPISTMIKTGNDIANETIDSELIKKNADAIMYANVVLLKSLEGFDANTLNNVIVPIQTLIKLGAEIGSTINSEKILVNSKSITTFMTDVVDKQFPKSEKNINSMRSSLDNLKKSFKNLDDILIKDSEKRNKALENLNKNLKDIITTLTDNKDAMDSYNTMLDKTAKYTPPQNTQYDYGGQQYQPPYNPNNNNGSYNGKTPAAAQEPAFDSNTISEAIKSALQGLQFTVEGFQEPDALKLKTSIGLGV